MNHANRYNGIKQKKVLNGANSFHLDFQEKVNKNKSLIKCTYDIKKEDLNKSHQIINNRYEEYINKDIESKVKLFIDNKKEKLIYKRRFIKLGINTVYFIIEENLKDMSFMFYNCSSLKKIEFISVSTQEVTDMSSMFDGCYELEYIDLSNFNTINVKNMSLMFNECHKLKKIIGINKLNTMNVTDMNTMFQECNEF